MRERLVVHRVGLSAADAPTLVLLHGLTDSGRGWVDVMERWADRFRLVTIDALGHGESDRWRDDELASDEPVTSIRATSRSVAPRSEFHAVVDAWLQGLP